MGYCSYMTRAGYALQAKLFAEGGNFKITRVMVGSGACPEGTLPSELTDLVNPMARATSTKPVRAGCEVSLIIEYRSDLSPELETPFQLTEFGVFSLDVEGDEALVLYGDLTTCPDTAVPLKYGGCVRRYPVNITVGPDVDVSLAYPAGAWMTHEEAEALIQAAVGQGLDMGDGTTVGEAVGKLKTELDETKQGLDDTLDSFKRDVAGELDTLKRAVDGSSYYHVFEPSDWTGNELRVPASRHGMEPMQESCICTLRQRVGRTAFEYGEADAGTAAEILLEAVKAALAANAVPDPEPTTEPETPSEPEQQGGEEDAGTVQDDEAGTGEGGEPGTELDPAPTPALERYPVAEDGHVILTWEQVQYLLLESTTFEETVEPAEGEEPSAEPETRTVWNLALASAEIAAAKAEELGFGRWKERDNGVEPTATLDELLTAAYLPALGGPSASFMAMVTAQALQGLRLRRGTAGEGYAARYDMDGHLTATWGTTGCEIYWDLDTQELVVDSAGPFAGDILVADRADTGQAGAGA